MSETKIKSGMKVRLLAPVPGQLFRGGWNPQMAPLINTVSAAGDVLPERGYCWVADDQWAWDLDCLEILEDTQPAPEVPKAKPERDSNGHAPGRKDDGGKAPWGLLMRGCSRALIGVVAVLQFGARKYAADSWQRVEGAEERYKDALYRHLHSIETRGILAKDPETGLLEWFHVACNALFLAHFASVRAEAEAVRETR